MSFAIEWEYIEQNAGSTIIFGNDFLKLFSNILLNKCLFENLILF